MSGNIQISYAEVPRFAAGSAASLICMMPRTKSTPEVLRLHKAAVARMTSTTNWSDIFVNADKFPQILKVPDRAKYQIPAAPELNHDQLRLVGWDEAELETQVQGNAD